jgi:uncharacterized protein
MESEDLEEEFIDYIEHLAHQAVSNTEMELRKARECKNMLELPSRKENWDIQENAEREFDEHFKRAMSYLREVVVLSQGMDTYKNGLIYKKMKLSNKVK